MPAPIKGKGRKIYRTMQGRQVDLDLLIKRNELTPAVGNARVNARGDELGPGGKIIRKREEVVKEYYDKNSAPVVSETVSSTPKLKADPVTSKEQEMFEEFDEEPVKKPAAIAATNKQWTEDKDGNFVKK